MHCHSRAGQAPPHLGVVVTGSERSHASGGEGTLTSTSLDQPEEAESNTLRGTFQRAECSRLRPRPAHHVNCMGAHDARCLAGNRNRWTGMFVERLSGKRGEFLVVWLNPHAKNTSPVPLSSLSHSETHGTLSQTCPVLSSSSWWGTVSVQWGV